MHRMRLLSALLLLGLAACASTQNIDVASSLPLTIDQPTPPFPYNSRICP